MKMPANIFYMVYMISSFCLFAFFHSFAASLWFKERFAWFKRAYYNIFSFIFLIPFIHAWFISSQHSRVLYDIDFPYALLFYILILIGAGIFIAGASEMDLLAFLGFREEKENGKSTFSQKGMHSIVRHPMYLGLIIIIWSFPKIRFADLIGNALITLYLIFGAFLEERKLLKKFGKSYADYRKRTPMLIPNPFRKKGK